MTLYHFSFWEKCHNFLNIITPLIKDKKQTVNQIYQNHPDLLYFSKSEFYKLVNDGYLNIINLDLPRKVKYNKRKSKIRRTREESLIRIGRTYNEYTKFIKKHNIDNTTQLDTVEGEKGGKVFLTITLVKYQFMFIYLLESQDSENVSKKILWIRETIGDELYIKIFYCTLTDNGKEFYQPEVIENINNIKKCNVFYCDPSSPWQKGTCEENHHYIRYVLPKEVSTFNNLTQEDCNILMSNINNIPREKLNGKTPYEAILEMMTEDDLLKLGNELPRGKPSIVHRTIASLRERGIIPSVLTNAIFYEASLGELNPKRLKKLIKTMLVYLTIF